MLYLLRRIVFRLALCAAAAWLMSRFMLLPLALVATAPLLAVALARPLVELSVEVYRSMRRGVYHDVQGRFYAFRGHPIAVQDDDHGRRWVSLASARTVLPDLMGDASLAQLYPRAVGQPDTDLQGHIEANALIAHLRGSREAQSRKFRYWLQANVADPAARQRERSLDGDAA